MSYFIIDAMWRTVNLNDDDDDDDDDDDNNNKATTNYVTYWYNAAWLLFNLLLDERLVQVVWWWCHILLLQLIWIEIICTCTSIVRWWSYGVCRSCFRWLEPFHWMVQPINIKWIAVIHYRTGATHTFYSNITCNTSATMIKAVPNIPSGYYQCLIRKKKLSQLLNISNYYYYNRHHMSCMGLQIPAVISKLNIIYLVTVAATVLFQPVLTGSPSLYYYLHVSDGCKQFSE